MFTSTIWLIGLLGTSTVGVVGWSIYQRHRPGMPVMLDNKSEFRTLVSNDSITRHDSRNKVLARGQKLSGTPVTVH
ncbi:hypothetical protein GCM10027185_02470 [Spirosoma pulveris]